MAVSFHFRHYVEDMVPGARETFAAVLGEDVPKKPPALAAPPSKLKTKPPPPAVKEEKPPKQLEVVTTKPSVRVSSAPSLLAMAKAENSNTKD